MPTVRTYGERRVARAALPGARKHEGETPVSTGAGLADAEAQKWGAAAQVGHGLARQATGIVAELTKAADETAVLEQFNQLAAWKQKRLYDAEGGALTVKGKAAMPLPETVQREYQEFAGSLEKQLTTDRQRGAFARERGQQGLELDLTLRRHVLGEMQQYESTELKAFLENTQSEAIANALDPVAIDAALERTAIVIKRHGPRAGLGPEAVEGLLAQQVTGIHVGVIKRLIADAQDTKAEIYFKKHEKELITGDARAQMAAAVESAATLGAGLRTAETLWTQHGPTGDSDPIALDTMETAARAQFADEPKKLKATIDFLRERKAGVDASRADRKEQISGALWGAVAKGTPLATVQRTPEYLAAPGQLQAQIASAIVREAEHRADRSYMLANRGRDEGARVENEKERAGWTMLWHYDKPEILAQMTDNQVLALSGDLGVDHVNRLMTKKRALVKSDETVRAAAIDEDLFKTTAMRAGLDAYSPKTDDEKADLGQLRNAVETAIDAEQRATGKALTRDRKQAIATGIIDQKVLLRRWGTDPERVAAMVRNPDDRATAYVPLDRIVATKPKTLANYLNYARSTFPQYAHLDDEQMKTRFGPRIERAYALHLLGESDAAVAAVFLEGE